MRLHCHFNADALSLGDQAGSAQHTVGAGDLQFRNGFEQTRLSDLRPRPRRATGRGYLFSLGSLKYLVPLIVSSAASPLEVNWYTRTPGETDCASVMAAP